MLLVNAFAVTQVRVSLSFMNDVEDTSQYLWEIGGGCSMPAFRLNVNHSEDAPLDTESTRDKLGHKPQIPFAV